MLKKEKSIALWAKHHMDLLINDSAVLLNQDGSIDAFSS